MTLPDPMWIELQYVRDRHEAYIRQREIRRQLARPDHHATAVWLGAGFIFIGDRMLALGGRLCPSCPCPDVQPAIEPGIAAR